jgi:hypothetical protein
MDAESSPFFASAAGASIFATPSFATPQLGFGSISDTSGLALAPGSLTAACPADSDGKRRKLDRSGLALMAMMSRPSGTVPDCSILSFGYAPRPLL